MDVSVIIVNYNTRQFTKNCIDSVISKTEGVEYEIILVDNNSTDGSVELFRRDKRIVFIESGSNIGFGRANNLGYEASTGKYILLLNSDTLLLNNVVKLFFDSAEKEDENIACFGSLLLNYKGVPMHSFGSFPSLINHFVHIIKGYSPKAWRSYKLGVSNNTSILFKVDYITGADLFIRRSVIQQNGLFDPQFFMYYEETDLQYRYNLKGYHSVLLFSPQIIHLDGMSSGAIKRLRKFRIPLIGMDCYFYKHFSKMEYRCARLVNLLLIPKILVYPDSWSEKWITFQLLFKNRITF